MLGRDVRIVLTVVAVVLAVSAFPAPGAADAPFGTPSLPSIRESQGMRILSAPDSGSLPPELSSSGLLTQAHFLMQSYQGPLDDRTIIVGDALAGGSISIGQSDLSLQFGGGFRGSFEEFRTGHDDALPGFSRINPRYHLGVGAIGGAHYYLSDSIALFLQLHGVYELLGLPTHSSLRIEGGFQF
ncbi:MAG: hypothetical protein ACLFNQ_06965 [Spirochaetaceae bacterium]